MSLKAAKMVKSEMSDDQMSKTEESSSSSAAASPDIDVGSDRQNIKSPEVASIPGNCTYQRIPFRPFASVASPFEPPPPPVATGTFLNPFVDPKTLVEAYAARLQNEADYAR